MCIHFPLRFLHVHRQLPSIRASFSSICIAACTCSQITAGPAALGTSSRLAILSTATALLISGRLPNQASPSLPVRCAALYMSLTGISNTPTPLSHSATLAAFDKLSPGLPSHPHLICNLFVFPPTEPLSRSGCIMLRCDRIAASLPRSTDTVAMQACTLLPSCPAASIPACDQSHALSFCFHPKILFVLHCVMTVHGTLPPRTNIPPFLLPRLLKLVHL